MPRQSSTDLNHVVGRLVAEEVGAALGPYRELLDKFAAFTNLGRGADRPQASAAPSPKKSVRRRGRRGPAPAVRRFDAGAKVRFKQGRGTFDGTVVSQDPATNVVLLKRSEDGKEFKRGAGVLRAARG